MDPFEHPGLSQVPRAIAFAADGARPERAVFLLDEVEGLLRVPDHPRLTDHQRALTLELLRKLVDWIEAELISRLASSSSTAKAGNAWAIITRHGVSADGLAEYLLARVLDHLMSAKDPASPNAAEPSLFPGVREDPDLAALWTRFLIAERRRRDAWGQPAIAACDLPVELQAGLTDAVAAAMIVAAERVSMPLDQNELRAAIAASMRAHREEISLEIAAGRLVEAAVSVLGAEPVLADLIERRDWAIIVPLIARRTGRSHAAATLLLTCGGLETLIETFIEARLPRSTIGPLLHAIALNSNTVVDADATSIASALRVRAPAPDEIPQGGMAPDGLERAIARYRVDRPEG